MATQGPKEENLFHLDRVTLQDVPNREYTLRLFVERELQKKDNLTWTPAQRPDVSSTSHIRVEIRMKSRHSDSAKYREASEVIDLHGLSNDYWNSNNREFTVLKTFVIGKHSGSLELQFSANDTAEALRTSLHELEGLLKEYSPLMGGPGEKSVDKTVKYDAVFAKLNPIAKAIVGVARVTFELLKEQNKCDQVLSGLCDRLQRIVPLAKKVAYATPSEETERFKELIPRMFEAMGRVAKFSCDYIKRARTGDDPSYLEIIDEMDRELTKVIEEFDRIENVKALHLANETKRVERERNFVADDRSHAQPSLWYNPCYIPSHNWLSTPCECPTKQARMNPPSASSGPSTASPNHRSEAGFPLDNLDTFLDTFSSLSLTNGGYLSVQAPVPMMDEGDFQFEEEWRDSPLPGVQYLDASQQNALGGHLTIDTKDLLVASPEPFSPPMHATTSIPIPGHLSPGNLSLKMTPSITSSTFLFSPSAGLSPEGASPYSPFGLRGSPQVPCVNTAYDELLNQGYPGSSPIARERREVLRRTISNEIAQQYTNARDIKRLADVRRVTDVIPEDDLPSSGKKTAAFVLQCAWVGCNHYCSRPDRFKTHLFTHIQFKPFPCDRSCGDPHCTARFFSKGDCNTHQTRHEKKKICENCGEECTGKNWQRHARSLKCKSNGRTRTSI